MQELAKWRRCRRWRGDGHKLRHGDVDIPRRFCWRVPDRGDPRCLRVVPDVARISDPLRLRIQKPVAIPPTIMPIKSRNNAYGPGDPSSAVTVHGDGRDGGRAADSSLTDVAALL